MNASDTKRTDELLRALSPVAEGDLEPVARSPEWRLLREEITGRPREQRDEPVSSRRRRRFHTPLRVGAALAGAAAAAALAIVGIGVIGSDNDRLAFAAEWVRIAEENPRLLVTAPGWNVSGAEPDSMTFSDGAHSLEVEWRDADDDNEDYRAELRELARGNERSEIALLDRPATVIGRRGSTEYTTFLPPEGGIFLKISGDLGGRKPYLEVIRSLEPTDVETWLSALPPSLVRPGSREAVAAERLGGAPLPPGFDLDALGGITSASSRAQFDVDLVQSVACGWIDEYLAATEAGDTDRARAATAALATSRDWPVLRELDRQGQSWAQAVWDAADAMAAGATDPSAFDTGLGCGYLRDED
jgi:hypothetical protein